MKIVIGISFFACAALIAFGLLKFGLPFWLTTDYEAGVLYNFDFKHAKVDSSKERLILTKTSDIKGRFQDPACASGIRKDDGTYVWIFLNPRGWNQLLVHPKGERVQISASELDSILAYCDANKEVSAFLRKSVTKQ